MTNPTDPRARGERLYRSDDRDLDRCDNDLAIFYGENGDWYITIRPHGERFSRACVRVTTHGAQRGFEGVGAAVHGLYRALGGEDAASTLIAEATAPLEARVRELESTIDFGRRALELNGRLKNEAEARCAALEAAANVALGSLTMSRSGDPFIVEAESTLQAALAAAPSRGAEPRVTHADVDALERIAADGQGITERLRALREKYGIAPSRGDSERFKPLTPNLDTIHIVAERLCREHPACYVFNDIELRSGADKSAEDIVREYFMRCGLRRFANKKEQDGDVETARAACARLWADAGGEQREAAAEARGDAWRDAALYWWPRCTYRRNHGGHGALPHATLVGSGPIVNEPHHACDACRATLEANDVRSIESAGVRELPWAAAHSRRERARGGGEGVMGLDDLDPGIRNVVAWLRARDYETTDSGDGKTKIAAGDTDALDFPHVFMRAKETAPIEGAARVLMRKLRDVGVAVRPQGMTGAWIEATYDPENDVGMLMLGGLDDEGLAAALETKNGATQ